MTVTDDPFKLLSLTMAIGLFCFSCRTPFSSLIGTGAKTKSGQVCPSNFVKVSGFRFCVSKYEMRKDAFGNAVSVAEGLPWVNINRGGAIHACQRMGRKFDLITNDEWQALAKNLELVDSNWSGGAVGKGSIHQGHSDNQPEQALSSIMDEERRSHTLSTGERIWDVAGNVWEWGKDTNNLRYEDSYSVNLGGELKKRFGPYGSYPFLDKDSHRGMGLASLGYVGNGRGIIRGGAWHGGIHSGIFAVKLGVAGCDPHLMGSHPTEGSRDSFGHAGCVT